MELFKRMRKRGKASSPNASPAADRARLGVDVLAVRLESGDEVPAECTAVVIAESGQTRRVGAFGKPRLSLAAGELAWCFHPGPYVFAVTPFAAATETGLRVEFLIDAGDPRVQQQRFDLFLASEWCGACGPLSVSVFGAGMQLALQNALAEGMLDLAPCTSIEEWHAFRAGLNELLYTRFGVTVQDCYPVDLHPDTDLGATLSARRAEPAPAAPSAPAATAEAPVASSPAPGPVEPVWGDAPSAPVTPPIPTALAARGEPEPLAEAPLGASMLVARAPESPVAGASASVPDDARALRRLFLELPPLTSALRMITPPSAVFAAQQELLQRLSLAALDVNTMPALAWKAPDQPLPAAEQGKRAAATQQAVAALDAIWSLLARLKLAGPDDIPALFDEADRLIANLEFALSARRSVLGAGGAGGEGAPAELQGGAVIRERREPTLGPEK
jgi:hypothetical protein